MSEEDLAELRLLTEAVHAHADWLASTGVEGVERSLLVPVEAAAPLEPASPRVEEAPRTMPAAARPAAAPPPVAPRPALPPTEPGPVRSPAAPPMSAVARAPAEAKVTVEPAERRRRLEVLAEQVSSCTRCGLAASRTHTVFARGDGSSGLCFIGEGPGADEDAQGVPFVGAAGQLLDKMIAAMGLGRDEVYVANIVKCRPPKNRTPEPEEMAACMPYLAEQLELIEPRVIVALGKTAVQGLLGTTEGITKIRGRWRLFGGRIAVMPTFHPAYLLRNPAAKREVWADLQTVLKHMGRELPPKP